MEIRLRACCGRRDLLTVKTGWILVETGSAGACTAHRPCWQKQPFAGIRRNERVAGVSGCVAGGWQEALGARRLQAAQAAGLVAMTAKKAPVPVR